MGMIDGFPGASGRADKIDLRKVFSGTIARDKNGKPRTGVFPYTASSLVTARSDMKVNVGRFYGVAERGGGTILMANDGTVAVDIPAAPTSGSSRYDVVYFRQNESTTPGAEANDDPVIEVLSGAPSGLPEVPDISTIPGAVELATVLVPAGKTATNQSGVVITQTYQMTAAAGGIVRCRSVAELNGYDAMDNTFASVGKLLYVREAGNWVASFLDDDQSSISLASGWNTPSFNALIRRSGWVQTRFNAFRSANLAPGGVIGTVPVGYRSTTNSYGVGMGLAGAQDVIPIVYDPSTDQLKTFNRGIAAGQSLLVYMIWRQEA